MGIAGSCCPDHTGPVRRRKKQNPKRGNLSGQRRIFVDQHQLKQDNRDALDKHNYRPSGSFMHSVANQSAIGTAPQYRVRPATALPGNYVLRAGLFRTDFL